MSQGKIIEYIEQGKFICGLCLQEKGSKLHLLTTTNREINLSEKRAVVISKGVADTSRSREELLEALHQAELTRIRLKDQVDVKELWELIRDEEESFDLKYLAHLVFGEGISDDHISAVARRLFEDRLHFKMKDGRFLPNSQERVEQILKKREEDALREQRLEQGSSWLKALREGRSVEAPRYRDEIVHMLIQLALYGKEAADYPLGKEMLSRADVYDIGKSRNLLIELGIWEEDENLDLLRAAVDTEFSTTQLEESTRLAGLEIDWKGREDLRDLPTVTIDGPLTRDYDDALSLEQENDTLRLGIHIADVASVVEPESILDQEARGRASSLYMPRKQIPMIPSELSQERLSLKEGCDRPAISLLVHLNKDGTLLDHRFAMTVIRVRHCLTYEQVNDVLDAQEGAEAGKEISTERWAGLVNLMHQISQRLGQKRMSQGALRLSLPELQVGFNADLSLSLELAEQDTPSRLIVAEFMILYNWLAALFCRDHEIPVIFRTQAPPSEILSLNDEGYLYYVFQQRRKLSPLQMDTVPSPHSGLGLDAYIQATSPIRRYLDLVLQRQIRGFLGGVGPVYAKEGLEEIRVEVEPVTRELERIKRNRLRYWILKFLSQNVGKQYRAIVLDEMKAKYRIVLIDFLLTAEVRRRNGLILSPGQEVVVEVKKSDPFDDVLRLDLAEGGP